MRPLTASEIREGVGVTDEDLRLAREALKEAEMPNRGPVIAIDFDGTLVEHTFPEIGANIGAGDTIRRLQRDFPESRWILLTMRDGETLDAAVAWCR